uniref:G-protein coupled receptors family 1 profile domain-containing protein n=1 Tax=Callorhinchus milii TaxID=7868 RepID=A0A4W3GPU7_CALMI
SNARIIIIIIIIIIATTRLHLYINLVAIVILSRGKCGLSKCITRYLVAMAVADLLVIFVDVFLNKINNLYFPLNILFYTPVCSVRIVLMSATMHSSLWFTVAFTFDRFVAICCQTLKPKYCTERTATVVIVILIVFSCSVSIPCYYMFDPYFILNDTPWYCVLKPSFYTFATWIAFQRLHRVAAPVFGFALICLFNALIIRHILMASNIRRRLRGQRNDQKTIDTELEHRMKSVILLFAISGSFILLWTTFVIHSFKWQLSNFNYSETFVNNTRYIIQETGIMLQRLSSCINPCIYGLTQTKFREELKKGLMSHIQFWIEHTVLLTVKQNGKLA